jgi:TIR domain
MGKLFLSHAVLDKSLTDAFLELLEMGIGFQSDEIFCSSSENQGIPFGEDFAPHMRGRLQAATVVVALVTPNYYASPFCLCESGAAWYSEKPFLPILTPPVGYSDLRGALYGKQTALLDVARDLDRAFDQLRPHVAKPHDVSRWNVRRDKFLSSLSAVLAQCGKTEFLSATEGAKLKSELAELQTSYGALDEELSTARKQITALEQVRPAEKVTAIRNEFSTDSETFDELLGDAHESLRKVPRPVREALFLSLSDDQMSPDEAWESDVTAAVQEDFLNRDEDGVRLNERHPKIRKSLKALRDLHDWMREQPEDEPASFRDHYEAENGDTFELTNRAFWRRHQLFSS